MERKLVGDVLKVVHALCKKDMNLNKYSHLIEEARGVLCSLGRFFMSYKLE
jgi:hypothetical protein